MKEETQHNATPLQIENSREKVLIHEVVEKAKPLLVGTHLLDDTSAIDHTDVQAAERALQAVFPVDVDNYRVHAHLQLASEFGRIFGERLGLNPNEIQLVLLGHDDGRFITQRWFRNELVAGSIFSQLVIRKDLLQKMPLTDKYPPKDVTGEAVEKTFHKLTDEQKVVILADICGKRRFDDWGIWKFDDVLSYHFRQRAKEAAGANWDMYPSEKRLAQARIEFDGKLYGMLKDWIGKKGVDVEKVRQSIIEKEKTAQPRAIVFDIGDVLVSNPDPDIIGGFSKMTGLTEQKVAQALSTAAVAGQTGELNEEQYWQTFTRVLGHDIHPDQRGMIVNGLDAKMKPETYNLINNLHAHNYLVATLSDTIPAHLKFLKEKHFFDHIDIPMSSVDFHVSKKRGMPTGNLDNVSVKKAKKVAVYGCMLAKLQLPPQACVFIDDKQEYLDTAHLLGIKTIQYKISEPLGNLHNRLVKEGIRL